MAGWEYSKFQNVPCAAEDCRHQGKGETMNRDANCIFCKIIDKKIPSKIVHEDDVAIAFEDVNPQAPVHLLIVPKKHMPEIHSITVADREIIGHLFFVARSIAAQKKLDHGYRMVINNGRDAGQTVFHVHLHLLSGRAFHWPPG
ncbi:MAG: histidine triad nucleotide-binding protein [Nitrospiraceae bacterium]|nr:histidine triad nucleotide-binding protein [Nitrospiraceae bacterium]